MDIHAYIVSIASPTWAAFAFHKTSRYAGNSEYARPEREATRAILIALNLCGIIALGLLNPV
jgi:hypothetical protein